MEANKKIYLYLGPRSNSLQVVDSVGISFENTLDKKYREVAMFTALMLFGSVVFTGLFASTLVVETQASFGSALLLLLSGATCFLAACFSFRLRTNLSKCVQSCAISKEEEGVVCKLTLVNGEKLTVSPCRFLVSKVKGMATSVVTKDRTFLALMLDDGGREVPFAAIDCDEFANKYKELAFDKFQCDIQYSMAKYGVSMFGFVRTL